MFTVELIFLQVYSSVFSHLRYFCLPGSRVTLTDRPDSLDVLKENVELNTKQCSNKHIEKDALYKVASTMYLAVPIK
ncbi:hypothetical protein EB796_017093 [Bugula neritina]|uniref:Uncharacterized protein n=1 Tax=Bugula neritina TaxID=10212 RepID=A0A7J7JE66_BUGNE|nr:hypothetical protein EB796_017093 [Bugula neritina]